MNGVPPVKYHVGRGTRARPSQPIYFQWFAETRRNCQRPVGLSHVCAHEGRMWGPEELQPPVSSQDLFLQARVFATPCFFFPRCLPASPALTQGPAHLWSFSPCLGFSFSFSLPAAQAFKTIYEHCLGIAALFGLAVPLWLPSLSRLSSTFGLVESSHARLDSYVYGLEMRYYLIAAS